MKDKLIVGEDMICPITKKHCVDECCPVGAECNLSGNNVCEPESPSEEMVKLAHVNFEKNKKLITNFLDWYYEEGLKTPMRFETDHDDIAMMFLTEGNY